MILAPPFIALQYVCPVEGIFSFCNCTAALVGVCIVYVVNGRAACASEAHRLDYHKVHLKVHPRKDVKQRRGEKEVHACLLIK